MEKEFYLDIEGLSNDYTDDVRKKLKKGEKLLFRLDPYNKYNKYLTLVITTDHIKIGCVPMANMQEIATNIISGRGSYKVEVEEVTGGSNGALHGVKIKVLFMPTEVNLKFNKPTKLIQYNLWNINNLIDLISHSNPNRKIPSFYIVESGYIYEFNLAYALIGDGLYNSALGVLFDVLKDNLDREDMMINFLEIIIETLIGMQEYCFAIILLNYLIIIRTESPSDNAMCYCVAMVYAKLLKALKEAADYDSDELLDLTIEYAKSDYDSYDFISDEDLEVEVTRALVMDQLLQVTKEI